MKLHYLIAVLFMIIFQSCDKNRIYRDFDSNFEKNHWESNDSRSFTFTLEKDENANLALHFGHIFDFQFDAIPLQVGITYPDGHTEILPINLKIKNEKGEDIADCSGDVCDLYYNIKNNTLFQKGTYLVIITNKFNAAYLPNVLGVGIQVTK